MTDQERDDLLLSMAARLDRIDTRLDNLEKGQAELKQDIAAVKNGLQDLRRDREAYGMLPPAEKVG